MNPDSQSLTKAGLVGIIACGGKSSRMGMDKSLLNYHGTSQRKYLHQMLVPVCDTVCFSFNATQVPEADEHHYFTDAVEYAATGPIAALLTARKHFPGKSFLLIGCDYPLIGASDICGLIQFAFYNGHTSTIYNDEAGLYEPLLGFYQAGSMDGLLDQFQTKNYSLQYFLENIQAGKFISPRPHAVRSVDDFASYKQAMQFIGQNIHPEITAYAQ
jgi:molybdopterin-guanine dinucleotide biosynthesis protein A